MRIYKPAHLTRYFSFLIPVVLFLLSCQREISMEQGTTPTPPVVPVVPADTVRVYRQPAIDLPKVTGSLSVYVFDKNNKPIADALVSTGTVNGQTDSVGYVSFKNIPLSKINAFIRISKAGYFSSIRSFPAASGKWNFQKIQLRDYSLQGTVSGISGGEVAFSGGGKVVLPANGVVVASSGQPYSGSVKVYSSFIDPSSRQFLDQLPGDLRGILFDGNERALVSYGMLQVELKGGNDEALQLKSGEKARLVFPIPASLAAKAPDSIALWYLADSLGRWMEEAKAYRNGTTYEATVKHFSFWNCDYAQPYDLMDFDAIVVNPDRIPIFNAHVLIRPATDNWGGHGYTDENGYFMGRVPKNVPLVFDIVGFGNCYSTVLFSMPLGTFTGTENIDTIVANPNLVNLSKTIAGNLYDCAGSPVTNGYVQINIPGFNNYRIPITNGGYQLAFTSCQSIGEVQIYGVDLNANQQSPTGLYNFNGASTITANIQACGIVATEWVNLKIDSSVIQITRPPNDTVYKWQSWNPDTTVIKFPAIINVSGRLKGTPVGTDFSFYTNYTAAIGTYPLKVLNLYGAAFTIASITSPNPSVLITEWGSLPGTFMAGTITVQVIDTNNQTHSLSIDFRLRN